MFDKRENIRRRGIAAVDDEAGVLVRNLSAADTFTL